MSQIDYSREIELLTSLGFELYDPNNQDHWEHDIKGIDEYDLLYIDMNISRHRFYVRLSESCNDDVYYQVYVLNDVGCGCVEMPFQWSNLEVEWLTYLKMAFELHGFKTDK